MPNGWREYVIQVTKQSTRADPKVRGSIWLDFVQRSQSSPRAPLLQKLVTIGQMLPTNSKVALALTTATLLAPLEWPPEWEAVRQRLVESLDGLLRAMDPQMPDSLPALLYLREDEEVHLVGFLAMKGALALLRTPCRRDELRSVARLCTVGHTACLRAYRRALARRKDRSAGPLLDARMRYVVAFEHYAFAARALNSASGIVLFEGLDSRLEAPED